MLAKMGVGYQQIVPLIVFRLAIR